MKKHRTFQDVSQTYGEVMREVLKDTTGSWAKICVDDRKMEQPVYQIEETDWEFIRQMSGKLGHWRLVGTGRKSLFRDRKTCRSEGGILCFRYILSDKKCFIAERYENLSASGCLLRASVLESRNEQVKVKFDIDKEQPVNEAYWYPWRPDTGNIVRCMPVKGETVYIHLGDASGKQVRVICGVHNNGSGNPEMQA